MKKSLVLICHLLCIFACANAQQIVSPEEHDVFAPISKYFSNGDYTKLSAWFADNLEFEILVVTTSCSRNQGRLIMKNFFSTYAPRSFAIIHKSGKSPMSYAVGELVAGGEKFRVIIYAKTDDGKNFIQQLCIEKE